jgi:hypothetical protein
MLVFEPRNRSTWQKWFAWRPVTAAIIEDRNAETLFHWTEGTRPTPLLCFLRWVERREVGGVSEYAVRGRPATLEEYDAEQY